MYRLTESGVLKIDENMYIPNDLFNHDWQEYLRWVASGNTPEPIPGPTEEEIMRYNIDKRNSMLASTDWIVTRHRDQMDANLPLSYNEKQYDIILNWRQALRDMDFTIEVKPPKEPDVEKPSVETVPDTPPEDGVQDDGVKSPIVEHAQMVKMSLARRPTFFVAWPPMPDFMQGMFDDYPPKELGSINQMGV